MEKSLDRFLRVQVQDYDTAYEEMEHGRKVSHWIWYIFPQIKGLGRSKKSEYFGIESADEARRYLENDILSKRLYDITRVLLTHRGIDADSIMGSVDALKLKSSMTLFDAVSPHDIFEEVLDEFYEGKRCPLTLFMLGITDDKQRI